MASSASNVELGAPLPSWPACPGHLRLPRRGRRRGCPGQARASTARPGDHWSIFRVCTSALCMRLCRCSQPWRAAARRSQVAGAWGGFVTCGRCGEGRSWPRRRSRRALRLEAALSASACRSHAGGLSCRARRVAQALWAAWLAGLADVRAGHGVEVRLALRGCGRGAGGNLRRRPRRARCSARARSRRCDGLGEGGGVDVRLRASIAATRRSAWTRRRVASARPMTAGVGGASGRGGRGQAPGGRVQPCFAAQRDTVPWSTRVRAAMVRYGRRVVSTRWRTAATTEGGCAWRGCPRGSSPPGALNPSRITGGWLEGIRLGIYAVNAQFRQDRRRAEGGHAAAHGQIICLC